SSTRPGTLVAMSISTASIRPLLRAKPSGSGSGCAARQSQKAVAAASATTRIRLQLVRPMLAPPFPAAYAAPGLPPDPGNERAAGGSARRPSEILEHETGFEPATLTLAT